MPGILSGGAGIAVRSALVCDELRTAPALCIPAQIKQFYTAPTLIRSLMAAGEGYVKAHDRSSLRVLGTVGEPINPEAWRWYHEARRAPHHQSHRTINFATSQAF